VTISIGGVFKTRKLGKAVSRVYASIKHLKSRFESLGKLQSKIETISVTLVENARQLVEIIPEDQTHFHVAIALKLSPNALKSDKVLLSDVGHVLFRAVLLCPLSDKDKDIVIQTIDDWAKEEGFSICRSV